MSTINELSKLTNKILDAAGEAHEAIRAVPTRCNGWGILSDPAIALSRLHTAKDAIRQTILLIEQAKWPHTDADWDALEAEHNRGSNTGGGS